MQFELGANRSHAIDLQSMELDNSRKTLTLLYKAGVLSKSLLATFSTKEDLHEVLKNNNWSLDTCERALLLAQDKVASAPAGSSSKRESSSSTKKEQEEICCGCFG